MKKILATLLVLSGFLLGVGFTAVQAATTFKVVQTPVYHLYTGESGTATTMRITPYPTDLDGVKLTMSDFGSTPTVTVDAGLKGIEEIESFTGITDNGDGTATLTGLSRDLLSKYPYTTAGTGRTHGSGATVVFGNNPQIYGRLAAPENSNTWTGAQTFNGGTTFSSTTFPVYDGNPTFGSNSLALVNKAYVDSGLLNGAATSTFSNQGLVWLATDAQVSAGTASSTTGSPLVIPAKNATSTYNGATVRQGLVPALRSTKNIDPNFIATSSSDTYNFGGTMSFTGQTTFTKTMVGGVSSTTYSGSTVNIDWSAGQTAMLQLNQSTTITFTNVTAGTAIRAIVCQDGTGSRTVSSWPASIRWQTGFAPTLTTGANKCDIISFLTGSSTTSVFGATSANF